MSEQNTLELSMERVDANGNPQPFNVTMNWSDFPGASTTVFDATVKAVKENLAYMDANYGYGSGWGINSVGSYGPGDGYCWQVQIDDKSTSNDAGLDSLAVTRATGNHKITFSRVKA